MPIAATKEISASAIHVRGRTPAFDSSRSTSMPPAGFAQGQVRPAPPGRDEDLPGAEDPPEESSDPPGGRLRLRRAPDPSSSGGGGVMSGTIVVPCF